MKISPPSVALSPSLSTSLALLRLLLAVAPRTGERKKFARGDCEVIGLARSPGEEEAEGEEEGT